MDRDLLFRLFWIAFALRGLVALTLSLAGFVFAGASADSVTYHVLGSDIAAALAVGQSGPRSSWIDDAWFRVIGHIYYWLGPNPLLIQLLNAILGSIAAVMTAQMAWAAYRESRLAFFAGWLVAVFPSFVYFNSLLLKDSAALLLISTLGWATIRMRQRASLQNVSIALFCLLGFLGIREYFFFMGAILVVISLLPVFARNTSSASSLVIVLIGFGLLAWALGFGVLGLEYFLQSRYTDIEYINAIREKLDRGSGGIGAAAWGNNILSDILSSLTGVYYFIFSVNPFDISSVRQVFALPEMLALVLAFPPMWRGLFVTWRYYRATALALIVFGFGVLAVYVSATTNMGALYRWRMQAFPFLFSILSAGLLVPGSRNNPIAMIMRLVTRSVKDHH